MMTFNDGGVIAYMNGMLARMAAMRPVMAEIGREQRNEIQDRILHGKQGPEGEYWAAWAPFTRHEREHKGNTSQGLLWDSGKLVNSIMADASNAGVIIGTSVPYAADLQYGTSGQRAMAERPFIGWSAEGKQVAEHFVVRYLEGIAL